MKKFILSLSTVFMAVAGMSADTGNISGEHNPTVNHGSMSRCKSRAGIRQSLITPSAAIMDSRSQADAAQGTIVVNSTHASEEVLANMIYIYNADGMYQNMDLAFGQNTATINVPAGTYDLLVSYTSKEIQTKLYYVIKEDIEVREDGQTEISVSPEDADHHLGIVSYRPDGEKWSVDIILYNEEDETEYISTEGNAQSIIFSNYLVNKTVGVVGGGYFRADFLYGEWGDLNECLDFYVSATSDDYYYLQSRTHVDKEGNNYINDFGFRGSADNACLSNEPTDYAVFKLPIDVPRNNTDEYRTGVNVWDVFMGNMLSGWTSNAGTKIVTQGSTADYYYDKNGCVGGIEDFRTLCIPFMTNIMTRGGEPDISYYSYPVYSQQVYNTGSTNIFVENTNDLFWNDACKYTGSDWLSAYPGLEAVAYSLDQKQVAFSGTSPYLVFKLKQMMQGKRKRFYTGFDFRSILGGVLDCYVPRATLSVKFNGEEVYTDIENYSLQFANAWYKDKHDDGVFDIKFVNETDCSGNICTNNTDIHFDQTQDDWTPPTLRMFQIRNADNNVTNVLSPETLGHMLVAVTDMNYNPDGKYYECIMPASTKISFSPAGENQWKEFRVASSPDEFYANYGGLYYIDMKDSAEYLKEGWYDVKVELADASGNSYSQLMENTFCVSPDSGIGHAITLSDIESVTYYDVHGRVIAAPESGVYIKVTRTKSGDIVSTKEIRK